MPLNPRRKEFANGKFTCCLYFPLDLWLTVNLNVLHNLTIND